jgi:hypothetical protein
MDDNIGIYVRYQHIKDKSLTEENPNTIIETGSFKIENGSVSHKKNIQ